MKENANEWELITQNLRTEINTSEKKKSQIAKEVGVNPAMISQYLSGRSFPELITLKRLCKVLGCTYEDILGKPE